MATKTLLTLDDYAALPEDGKRYELVEGEVVELTFPRFQHSTLQQRLNFALATYLAGNSIGRIGTELGFVLGREPDTLRSPDIYFVRAERLRLIGRNDWVEGAPDLAVEIISPSNTVSNLRRKVKQYFAAGARAVWTVYPEEREVHVERSDGRIHVLHEGDVLQDPELLPGFSFELREFFSDLG